MLKNELTAKYRAAMQLMVVLAEVGFEARMVGGCVRDQLLGLEPKDYDFACNATPQAVMDVLSLRGYRVLPTGLSHGTVTAVSKGFVFEITSLRKDVRTDGRRAEVVFGQDFEEDAARRDFTINAMYLDLQGHIYDYFDGQRHLQEKKLIFVGDPATRIKEDYLRILRFFRFKACFQLKSNQQALAAISAHCQDLKTISSERITAEIWRLFSYDEIAETVQEMLETQVLENIFPSLIHANLNTQDGYFHLFSYLTTNIHQSFRSHARLAVLFFWSAANRQKYEKLKDKTCLGDFLRNLRLSNAQYKCIAFAIEGVEQLPCLASERAEKFELIDFCEKCGGKSAFNAFYLPLWQELFTLDKATSRQEALHAIYMAEKEWGYLRLSPMPVSSRRIMRHFSLSQGPKLGKLLKYLFRSYRNGKWQSWEDAVAIGDNYLSKL